MPAPNASLTPSTIPFNSEPEAVLDDPISLDMEFSELWEGKHGITFADLLDIINPLQHIPVISTIYRAITGDEIGLGSRLVGGALFGGPAGFIVAGMQAGFEEATHAAVDVSSRDRPFCNYTCPSGGINSKVASAAARVMMS